ncbi:hypothetical protein [Streptacidiphilus sp. PAMC 29251]
MKRILGRAAAVAASVALAGSGALLAAGPANASSGTNISSWTSTYCLHGSGDLYCLWYLEGNGTGGAGWGSKAFSTSTISGNFNIVAPGGSSTGLGQPVRNDADSLSNGSSVCSAYVYVSPNYQGNWDYVSPSKGGNLNTALINNEASIRLLGCTS